MAPPPQRKTTLRPGRGSPTVHPGAPAGGSGPGPSKQAGPLRPAATKATTHAQSHQARYQSAGHTTPTAPPPDKIKVEEVNGVRVVTLANPAMRPFMRTFDTLTFTESLRRHVERSKLDVAINGMFYDISTWGKVRYVVGTPAAGSTIPEGIVRGRDEQIGGTSQPNLFYIAWQEHGSNRGYSFGMGDPPGQGTSAMGGLGPIIINGRPYASVNQYRKGVPDGAPVEGEPQSPHNGYLIRRGNRTFKSMQERPDARDVGKVIIGHSSASLQIFILVQPDGTPGMTLEEIREYLIGLGANNAVFLDGSDSATLFANDQFYVTPGHNKNITNTIGVGFKLP